MLGVSTAQWHVEILSIPGRARVAARAFVRRLAKPFREKEVQHRLFAFLLDPQLGGLRRDKV